jgi:hypothetical protein
MALKNQFGFFMTKTDEELFCNALIKEFPNIMFFDAQAAPEGNINKRL